MRAVVIGGTGFLGRAIVDGLCKEGHNVSVLTREPARVRPFSHSAVRLIAWDGRTIDPSSGAMAGADAVLNFAGESIGSGRWTAARKERLLGSRVDPTRAIIAALRHAEPRPAVFVSASAVGYYGSVEEGEVTEDHGPGSGFLADLCVRWEEEARTAEREGVRTVIFRMGVVLGRGAEALKRMLLPFKMFVGGPIGSGRQWFSWVHIDDVVGAAMHVLTNANLHGPVNVAAPGAVRMADFSRALGRTVRRPSWAPAPAFVLRLGLGEMSEMILTGQRVLPARLLSTGFTFIYPDLVPALTSVLR